MIQGESDPVAFRGLHKIGEIQRHRKTQTTKIQMLLLTLMVFCFFKKSKRSQILLQDCRWYVG